MRKMGKLWAFIACAALLLAQFTVSCSSDSSSGGGSGTPKVELSEIRIDSEPAKTVYNVGQEFNAEGMVVTAVYSDNSTLDVTEKVTTDFDSSEEGEKTVTVSYTEGEGEAAVTKTAEFKVQIVSAEVIILTSISVRAPSKTVYYAGDAFVSDGFAVSATYSDDSEKEIAITAVTTDFDTVCASAGENKVVTVTYTENEITVTATFTITVKKLLKSIDVTGVKTEYFVGESFSMEGVVVTATYENDETADVTETATYSGFDSRAEGIITVVFTYVEDGKTASKEFEVTIKEKKYTVTYKNADGSVLESFNGKTGTAVTAPEVPAKKGYEATWSSAVTSIGTEDITVTPNYQIITYTINYVFSGNGDYTVANPNETVSYTVEDSVELKAASVDGHTFAGWFAGDNKVESIEKGSTGNITLTGKFQINSYTVKFDLNGATGPAIQDETYDYGTTIELKSGEGYTYSNGESKEWTFAGWSKNPADGNAQMSLKVTEDVTLYMMFTDKNIYKVTFNSNGGTLIDTPASVIDGGKLSSDYTTSKAGYKFEGWYSDESLTSAYDFETPVTKDFVLYAKWSVVSYTISYVGVDELTNSNPVSYNIETAVTLVPVERKGYTFKTWKNGTADVSEIVAGTTGNITLTAEFEINKYTVTYDIGNAVGTAPASVTVDYNTAVTLASVTGLKHETSVNAGSRPTITYKAKGWKLGDTECDSTFVVTEDVTLTVSWTTGDVHRVDFCYADGSFYDYKLVEDFDDGDEKVTPPANPVKAGYAFEGWYTDKSLSEKFNFNTEVKTALNLYAKFTAESYTISYMNGEEKLGTATYTVEDIVILDTSFTKDGQVINNWKDESGNIITTIVKGTTGNKVFNASWIDAVTVESVKLPEVTDHKAPVVTMDDSEKGKITFTSSTDSASYKWFLIKNDGNPVVLGTEKSVVVSFTVLEAGNNTILLQVADGSSSFVTVSLK